MSFNDAGHHILEGTRTFGQKLLELYAYQQASAKETEPCRAQSVKKHVVHGVRARQIKTLCGVIRSETRSFVYQ